MKLLLRSKASGILRWQRHGVERLREALRVLQRLLVVDRRTEALALIPIRVVPPDPPRQRQRRPWRD